MRRARENLEGGPDRGEPGPRSLGERVRDLLAELARTWRRGRTRAVLEGIARRASRATGYSRLRILTRYMIRRFLKIWTVCVLGVPFVFVVIDLVDRLDTYLAQGATKVDVFWHYVYQFPYQALLAFPIACLLAAVFSISRMTRHFEITAAKAGGISFYRIAAPVLVLAFGISLLSLGLTEVVPHTNEKAEEALGQARRTQSDVRRNFVFRSTGGRVYSVQMLNSRRGHMEHVRVSREGQGFEFPTYSLQAATAAWDSAAHAWALQDGRLHLLPRPETTRTFRFSEAWQRHFTETPTQLLADPKDPKEMDYAELGRFIRAIERSGGDAADLKVERALKIAFPFTCFIIVLFGAPLANTTREGGPALSIGIALAITITFMILIRVAQALGAGGAVPPTVAAWLPNGLFTLMAAGLWLKVRS